MAYSQQPRYDAPSTPPYQHQQLSYESSQELYGGKNQYGPGSQATDFNSSSRRGPPQEHHNANAPTGSSCDSSKVWPNQDNPYGGGNGRYEGRGQNRGGRWPPAQRPHERPEGGTQFPHDPRSQGQPPPGRRYRQQDPYYPSDHFREPRGRYQSQGIYHNSAQAHENGEYEYDEFSLEAGRDWTPRQQYHRHPQSSDQSYQEPDYNAGYPQQDWGTPRNERISSGSHRNNQSPRQPEALEASFHQNQSNSTRPQSPQHPKPRKSANAREEAKTLVSKSQLTVDPAFHRTLEPSTSPDTVAWDNPFPTFPMRPSRAERSNGTRLNSSTESMSLRDESQQDPAYGNRPQTASSKGSYAVSPIGEGKLVGNDLKSQSDTPPSLMSEADLSSKGGGYFDLQSQLGRDAGKYLGTAQERPRTRDNGRRGARVDQLKPTNNGRHSEDNRTRPSLPFESRMDVSYERSRTMPTEISEAALKSGRPADQSVSQEPGFYTGYHNSEDRGYPPSGSGSRQGSFPQSKAYSDEAGPVQVDAMVHAKSTDSCQIHAQKDSLGEFFDTYYDATQDEHQPYMINKDRQRRRPAHGDMSNFNGVPVPSDAPRQGMTIDNQLHSQPKSQAFPPTPVHLRDDARREHRHDPSPNARHPRSRSQPNIKDRRSPRPLLDDGFDFGVPGAPSRPPATAPARNEYGLGANGTLTAPNTRRDQYQQDRQYQGSTAPSEFRSNDHNKAQYPALIEDSSPMVYQGNGPSDRYRSPPMQNGHSRQMGPPGGTSSLMHHQARPISPPEASASNPDALPSHPSPVRPGLMQSTPVNQAPKPVPLRQYNSTPSPMQSTSPPKTSGILHSTDIKGEYVPVTHQELEGLKQTTTRNPEDLKSQLLLAKKMVEAAAVLVDERTDPRTRNKGREKYILDAHKIVKKLSNNGYSEATFYLADAYSRGSLGLESDTREAFKLYQSAAKAGHAQAAYRVAVCCEIGHEEGGGTSRDAVKAMQWYKRAATLGDTPAMYKMGIISLKGLLGQPKNPKEAIMWLKRAAERADQENPHALHELVSLPITVKVAEDAGG